MIRPSLLSADFTNLKKDIDEMISLNITHCHFDVMDGTFVDDISFGETIFTSLKPYFDSIIFDVHLMVVNPLKQVKRFLELGVKEICFHFETLNETIFEEYKSLKAKYPEVKFGIAYSPSTRTESILPYLSFFDYVLVMSVVPGKGGQKFIPESLDKIDCLNIYKKQNSLKFIIGVDGGINEDTAKKCIEKGADFLVAGSFYFKATDKNKALSLLRGK